MDGGSWLTNGEGSEPLETAFGWGHCPEAPSGVPESLLKAWDLRVQGRGAHAPPRVPPGAPPGEADESGFLNWVFAFLTFVGARDPRTFFIA